VKLLIDTEVYLYRAASGCEIEVEWAPDDWSYLCRHGDAQAALQDTINEFRDICPDHQPVLVFGDRASFRYGIWPTYKANRKKYRKPAGYRQLVEWVEKVAPARGWLVERLPDVEGDDVLGILCEEGDVIASIDKDLLTIPGVHLRDGGLIDVSREDADRAFFTQVLVGDATDNYPGCPSYGPVTAAKALAGWKTEADFWREVVNCYILKGPFADRQQAEAHALTQARCARILRAGEYDLAAGTPLLWNPPVT
jgi:DNA polymerase-1